MDGAPLTRGRVSVPFKSLTTRTDAKNSIDCKSLATTMSIITLAGGVKTTMFCLAPVRQGNRSSLDF